MIYKKLNIKMVNITISIIMDSKKSISNKLELYDQGPFDIVEVIYSRDYCSGC